MTNPTPAEPVPTPEPSPTPAPAPSKQPFMSNRLYDSLKFLAQIFLPALGALYYGVAHIWGLPKADEIVGTLVVVDTFLGGLLHISTKQYNDGDAKYAGVIDIENKPDGVKVYSLNLNTDPSSLDKSKEVTFKVSSSL